MADASTEVRAREQRIDGAIATYLEAEDQGRAPDRREFLDRLPDLAAELEAFFTDHDTAGRLAAQMRTGGEGTDWPGRTEAGREAKIPAVPSTLSRDGSGGPPASAAFRRVGEYELLEEIGRSMAVVYKARQRRLNRVVALKMIRWGPLASVVDIRRFQLEAEAVAQLDHPHIVPVYEVGEHQGHWYFSMKLFEGGSLAEHLTRFRDDPRAAARLVVTIARAMHHAHQRGIRHRDLKPSNILLDADGRPHVADFGLAQRDGVPEDLTLSGAIVGTAPFMSPEQASGRKGAVTTATDVYGLGAILYTLLSGRPPFRAATVLETIRQVKEQDPQRLRALNRAVDPDLEAICLKCLEKDPQRRYGSADALANDLERRLRGEPTLARPVGPAGRLWRWAGRHPAGVGATTLIALLMWLALLAGFIGELRASNARETAKLAKSVGLQLDLLGRAISITAAQPGLPQRFRSYEGRPKERRAALEAYLQGAMQDFNRWFGLEGKEPLVNLYILDAEATFIADSNHNRRSIDKNFSLRDYWAGLEKHPEKAVSISRVFRSFQDKKYKFAVSTRIWDGDRFVGVLAATLPIDSRLVVLDLKDEAAGSAIVSPMDWSYAEGNDVPPEPRPEYIVVLRPEQSIPGQDPKWVAEGHHGTLDAFEDDPGLRSNGDDFTGDWCFTNYHRVGRTQFVVLIERPYPWLGFVVALALMVIPAGAGLDYAGRRARILHFQRRRSGLRWGKHVGADASTLSACPSGHPEGDQVGRGKGVATDETPSPQG